MEVRRGSINLPSFLAWGPHGVWDAGRAEMHLVSWSQFLPEVLVTFWWGHRLVCDYLRSQWTGGDDNLQLNLWTRVHHNYRRAKTSTAAFVIRNTISNAFIWIATTLLWFIQCSGCSAAALLPVLRLLWFYDNLAIFCVFHETQALRGLYTKLSFNFIF